MIKYKRMFVDSAFIRSPADGDAGYDIPVYTPLVIKPNEVVTVDTGVAVQVPEGFVGLLLGRSGNAFKRDVYVIHTGTIDSSYRDELKVRVWNNSDVAIRYTTGDYIAQLLVIPVYTKEAMEVSELDKSTRGLNGFGSTGLPGVAEDSRTLLQREVAVLW